ncbi:transcription factor RelB isoform 2-T2 [Menidia menidia]
MKDMDILNGTSEEPTPSLGILRPGSASHFQSSSSDFDLIEEIINNNLPGPPPPPQDGLCHAARSQSHGAPQQSPPAASRPVLVARGTACKPNFPAMQHSGRPPKQMASTNPAPSRVNSSANRGFSSAVSSQSQSDTDLLERFLEKPKLVVVEEPKDRGMRFRYECEGRSAGSILGASSTDANKTQPTIEIQGPIDHLKRVTVTVSLVTKDLPHRPHPHCLVGKDCPMGSGICKVSFNPHSNRRHSFVNLGIQCVRRKELDLSLQKRRNQNIDPFQTGHTKGIEDMDMNAVRLCFQCELEMDDGRKDTLSPVVSKPIYDKKATTTSELKICHLNLYRGSCQGKTEVYMLCDKVQKDDIEILFRRDSWKANGEFAQTDVHRQIAIVFKTPPYLDQDITEEVEVKVLLRRISDQMESEPVAFTYLPQNQDPYGVKRKRATIKGDLSFSEKACATESAPAPDQAFRFLLDTQTITSPEASQHTTQPVVDRLYNELMDSEAIDEAAIVNQLLELPGISSVLSDPSLLSSCFLDPNSAFGNIELNFNPNFPAYPQDFSQYSDLQFNMLVNESQNSQSEPQESVVQVKTEEEL